MPPVIRQDYLLRMIEQAARMLARLTGLLAEGKTTESIELTDGAAEQWLHLSINRLRALDDEEVIEHLRRQGTLPEFPIRVGVAVGLLRADSLRLSAAGDEATALERKIAALCLLLRAHILGLAPDLPEFTPGPGVFLHELPQAELPDRAAVLLMCYYEHTAEFGRAEDLLYGLRDRSAGASWVHELGEKFYERVLCHTDQELAEGNLPRQEVEESVREWRGHRPGGIVEAQS